MLLITLNLVAVAIKGAQEQLKVWMKIFSNVQKNSQYDHIR